VRFAIAMAAGYVAFAMMGVNNLNLFEMAVVASGFVVMTLCVSK